MRCHTGRWLVPASLGVMLDQLPCQPTHPQEVVDIEESIWSTKYGVKGMIDIRWGEEVRQGSCRMGSGISKQTCFGVRPGVLPTALLRVFPACSTQLVLDEPQQQQAQRGSGGWMQAAGTGGPAQQAAGPGGRQVTVAPVEIKTGKLHETHKAQVGRCRSRLSACCLPHCPALALPNRAPAVHPKHPHPLDSAPAPAPGAAVPAAHGGAVRPAAGVGHAVVHAPAG